MTQRLSRQYRCLTWRRRRSSTRASRPLGRQGFGDGGITYPCGGGREIHIYPSPDNAGKSGGTIAGWEVDDLEKTVDELTANGVSFEQHHSGPISTNEKGIAELGDDRVAWFKDPDGNVHGVAQI